MKGIRSAHEADVRAVYESSYARLVGIVALAAGDLAEAEDCVQEAFIRLLR